MPEISIVIPTHNRHQLLTTAISSVQAQSITDWELIIVDDGSAVPVENAFELSSSNVTVHRNAQPKGAAAARNVGASLAKGDFIAFLDDDDTLFPDYAEAMLGLFSQHGLRVGFAWPALKVIDEDVQKVSIAQTQPCLITDGVGTEEAFAATAYTRTTGMAFRSAVFRSMGGFDETLAVSEDREFVFRLLSSGIGCASLQQELVNFFVHAGPRLSTDANLERQAECDTRILHRHKDLLLNHPKLASRYLNLVAKRQKLAGRLDDYRMTLELLLKVRPFDMRARRRLLFLRLGR